MTVIQIYDFITVETEENRTEQQALLNETEAKEKSYTEYS